MIVNSTHHKKYHFKRLILFALFSLFFVESNSQFTFKDGFKKNIAPDVIVGENGGANGIAYLTSDLDDPLGAGWLRLTKATTNQGGYAYVGKSFPSTPGVVMDFEYKMWRNVPYSFDGADGIGIFLFDALVNYPNTVLRPKNGGVGIRPNAVSLRGPTNDIDLTQSHVFLTVVTILGGQSQSNYPGGPVCESVPTNVSVVTAKRCEVVSNPMVRQRVK